MTSQTETQSTSVNVRLADYLSSKKEDFISEWMERVQGDTRIVSTETLHPVLTKHLLLIFDDLTDTLRRYRSKTVADNAIHDAEHHGATRFRQGYELPEILRELKHFRAITIYHLLAFEDFHEDDGMAARLFVTRTVHGFIDELAIDATEEYLRLKLNPRDKIEVNDIS